MAEAHQFYLEDEGAGGDSGEVWTGTTLVNHFGCVPGLVVVGTGTQDRVHVSVEVWDAEPPSDEADFDHVGETSLEIRSGSLVLSECQGNPRLAAVRVEAGWYRVRISCSGLETADENDYRDAYRCQLWPAPRAADRVRRWFEPWSPGAPPVNPHGLRVMTGARAWDERLKMKPTGQRPLSGGKTAYLFRDAQGAYWEYGWHGKDATDLIEIPASEVANYKPWP